MLAERRAEAARLACEKAAKAEAERRKALLQMAADHRAAQDVRAFVDTAIRALHPDAAAAGPAADWAAWALGVADQIDPVGRLHIADNGTAAVRPAAALIRSACPDS